MNPKTLFLIDGLGALLSAFLLGVILVQFEAYFGMPQQVLYFLAAIPCLFALYDFYCYFRVHKNRGPFLKIIALANLLYCCLSIGLVILHFPQLTPLGLIYFFLEFIIVIALAGMELKTAIKLKRIS